jgi:hypothetical protein
VARFLLANQATAAKRRVYFDLRDATDGITPETGEAGGQPQLSTNGGAWTNTGIGTLTAIGNGRYYAELTQAAVATAGDILETRFKSANTVESPGDSIQVVAFDPDSATSLGLTRLDAAVSTRSSHAAADVWAVGTRALTDKAGFSLSAAGIQAIWDALTSALTTANSVGKLIVDNVNATISSRSSHSAADVWSVGTRALTDKAGFSLSSAGIQAIWDALTSALTTANSIGKLLVDNINATISSRATPAQVNAEVDTALADIHLDHLLAADYDPAAKPGVATALLNELVESDAGVSRFTANALEQAPVGGGGGATDWTAGEREQIRHRLGIDGTATAPSSATPSLAASTQVDDLEGRLTATRAAALDNLDVAVSTRLAAAAYTAPDNATITTISNKLGAFAGSGLNTVLGMFRALLRKDAALTPSDVGGTFDNTTESLEALKDTVLTGDAYARLGAPAGASVSADVAAAKAETAAIKAKTDNLPAAPAAVGSAMTLTTGERTSIAEALLKLDWSTVSGEASRSALNALRFIRNRWSIAGGTLTVRKEDDTTAAWTASVTQTAGNPVSEVDPT